MTEYDDQSFEWLLEMLEFRQVMVEAPPKGNVETEKETNMKIYQTSDGELIHETCFDNMSVQPEAFHLVESVEADDRCSACGGFFESEDESADEVEGI